MKKLVMLVTVVLTVAMAAVCFAAGDGNDLNKQQKIVDKFVAALTVADDSGYAGAAAGFSPELKQKMDVKAFAALQKQVKDTLFFRSSNCAQRYFSCLQCFFDIFRRMGQR